jgi:hypothetical protein
MTTQKSSYEPLHECEKPILYERRSRGGARLEWPRKCGKCFNCLTLKKKRLQHIGISRTEGNPYLIYGFDLFFITLTGDNFIKTGKKPGHIARKDGQAPVKCHCGRTHKKGFILTGVPRENWDEVIDKEKLFNFNLSISELWKETAKALRRNFGKETAYFLGLELQSRGVGHAHALVMTPKGKATQEQLPQIIRNTSVKGVKWGRDLDIKKITATDKKAVNQVIFYATKYVTKDTGKERETLFEEAKLTAEGKVKDLEQLSKDKKTRKAYDLWLEEELLSYIINERTDIESIGSRSRNVGMGAKLIRKSQNWSDETLTLLQERAKAYVVGLTASPASEDDKTEVRPARSEVNGRRDDRDRCDTLGGASGRQEDIIKHRSLERVSGVSLEGAGEPSDSEGEAGKGDSPKPLVSIEKEGTKKCESWNENSDLENSKPFLRDLFTGEKIFKPDSG